MQSSKLRKHGKLGLLFCVLIMTIMSNRSEAACGAFQNKLTAPLKAIEQDLRSPGFYNYETCHRWKGNLENFRRLRDEIQLFADEHFTSVTRWDMAYRGPGECLTKQSLDCNDYGYNCTRVDCVHWIIPGYKERYQLMMRFLDDLENKTPWDPWTPNLAVDLVKRLDGLCRNKDEANRENDRLGLLTALRTFFIPEMNDVQKIVCSPTPPARRGD